MGDRPQARLLALRPDRAAEDVTVRVRDQRMGIRVVRVQSQRFVQQRGGRLRFGHRIRDDVGERSQHVVVGAEARRRLAPSALDLRLA
jgi:hypothetical protein